MFIEKDIVKKFLAEKIFRKDSGKKEIP